MTARVAFGELRGENVVLTDAGGNELDHTSNRIDVVFLSRLDCEVKCLEVPPVPERELPALIRYRIRSVYPGSLENVAVDQIVQRGRGGLTAAVFLVDTATLQRYRAAAPGAALSLLSASLFRQPVSRNSSVIHWSPRYAEVMRFDAGRLVESTLVKRSRPPTDAQRVTRLLAGAPPDHSPVFLGTEAELLACREQFPFLEAQTRAIESMDFARRRIPSLFRQQRRLQLPRPALTRAALAAIVVLLATGVFLRYLHFKEAELETLRVAVLGSQASDQKQADLAGQYKALESRVAGLIQNRPVNVFQFLADLRAQLGPGAWIQDIVLQNGSFQFQAVGSSPLAYMRRFLADPRFRDVRLLQTTPIPGTSRQQFIITGKYAR